MNLGRGDLIGPRKEITSLLFICDIAVTQVVITRYRV